MDKKIYWSSGKGIAADGSLRFPGQKGADIMIKQISKWQSYY